MRKGGEDMEMHFFGLISACILLVCGVSGLHAVYEMRTSGRINPKILLGGGFTQDMCLNREEYIKKAAPVLFIFSCYIVVYGLVELVHMYLFPLPLIDQVGMFVFLVMLIIYGFYMIRLRKKYFNG